VRAPLCTDAGEVVGGTERWGGGEKGSGGTYMAGGLAAAQGLAASRGTGTRGGGEVQEWRPSSGRCPLPFPSEHSSAASLSQ